MTTTTTKQPAPFVPTAITTADAPTDCPAWCEGHSAEYAAGFGPFDDSKDYQEQRALFRTHMRACGDVYTFTGSEWILWIRQPEGEAVQVELTVNDYSDRARPEHAGLTLSDAETADLAGVLKMAAEAVQR